MAGEEKSVKRRLISFSNYSTCITLPKKALEKLGWRRGDLVTIDVDFHRGEMRLHRGAGKPPTDEKPRPAEPSRTSHPPPVSAVESTSTSDELRW